MIRVDHGNTGHHLSGRPVPSLHGDTPAIISQSSQPGRCPRSFDSLCSTWRKESEDVCKTDVCNPHDVFPVRKSGLRILFQVALSRLSLWGIAHSNYWFLSPMPETSSKQRVRKNHHVWVRRCLPHLDGIYNPLWGADYIIDVIAKQELTKTPPNYKPGTCALAVLDLKWLKTCLRSSLMVGAAGTAKTSTAKMFLNKWHQRSLQHNHLHAFAPRKDLTACN